MDKQELLPEEFPEGPVGATRNEKLGKSSPWKRKQRRASAYVYPRKEYHAGLMRDSPGSHPPHDGTEEF
ncbi:hypothetical protein SAMN05444392_11245 [Seinonella peptonophila]|uniref:Uncharacterized protein n=1 Tax=Seinonella peptonophila TaxID=112248 RepID=A0A1M5A6X3_9BACL|nr:hypothetical protein [Seinonella peptonophila]SHF25887.1 hypothetical protein SAMN05444392_11245 [Seinonella peptonophila]